MINSLFVSSTLFLSVFLTVGIFLPNANATEKEKNKKTSVSLVDQQSKRNQWLQSRHRAKPGFDWYKSDQQYRYQQQALFIPTNSRSDDFKPYADSTFLGQWKERGADNQSGSIVYALYDSLDESYTIASAGGLLWYSKENNIKWDVLNEHFRIDNIIGLVRKPVGSQNRIVVASANGQVYYSDNEGNTWTESTGLENKNGSYKIGKIIALKNAIYLLTEEFDFTKWENFVSLQYSDDNGASFKRIKRFQSTIKLSLQNYDLYSSHPEDTMAYTVHIDTLSTIDTKGNISFLSQLPTFSFGVTALSGNRFGEDFRLKLYRGQFLFSCDRYGKNWTQPLPSILPQPLTQHSFATSSTDSNFILLGGLELQRSIDNGKNWNLTNKWEDYYTDPQTKLHSDIRFVKNFIHKSKNEFFIVATDGGIYISQSKLQSVINLGLKGLRTTQYYSTVTESKGNQTIFAGAQDQGFQRNKTKSSQPGVLDFDQVLSGDYGHLGSSDNGKTLWMVNPDFVGFLNNPKAHTAFSAKWSFSDSIATGHWLPPLFADPNHSNVSYLAGGYLKSDPNKSSRIYKITNENGTIKIEQNPENFNTTIAKNEFNSAFAISKLDSNIWYTITNKGNFFYSSNGGKNWSKSAFFSGPEPAHLYGTSIYASAVEPNTVYVAGSGYSNPGIYVSNNGGRDFKPLITDLPSTLIHDIKGMRNDSLLFAATEVGAFVYVLAKQKWFNLSSGNAPDQVFWDVDISEEQQLIRFATLGRGIWDLTIKDIPKDTVDLVAETITSDPHLSVFPNPCNNQIHIQSTKTLKTVQLINTLGMIVKTWNIKAQQVQFDVATLPKGAYQIIVTDQQDNMSIRKLIKH